MHYTDTFAVDQIRHLGPAYAAFVVFTVGAIVAYYGLDGDPDVRC